MKEPPTLSIITVTLKAAAALERTLRSVAAQTCQPLEYMVIDGGSTDGTPEVLWQHRDRIDHLTWEPDRGLFDATNKTLDAATGDHVWFLNAGGEIFAPDTASRVLSSGADADAYYGETEIADARGHRLSARGPRVIAVKACGAGPTPLSPGRPDPGTGRRRRPQEA